MKITEFLSPQAVISELSGNTKPDVLRELCDCLARVHPQRSADALFETLLEREKLGSTGIGDGVAIPHGKFPGLTGLIAAFGVSHDGVAFDAIDGKKTHLFFALLAPENSAGLHLKALARISRLFKNSGFRDGILVAKSAPEIHSLIAQEDAKG